ncbi:hypothetical protein T05_11236 [Trichinella murrelli]|uniref:Uncharacterized protein n=1 Tax=Trichinella murrelli TaxID=144512 RepID=A0A0V0T5C7_9BILA|nr:hypothetical protein T05_11236 [Trichinella murrelli]
MLSVRRVVNYISALQNEPRNSGKLDLIFWWWYAMHVTLLIRLTTPSTPHHLNLNCSTQLKLVDSIFLSLWTPFLVLLFTSVCFKYGMTNIVRYINCTHFIHDSLTGEYDVSSDGIFS